MTAIGLYSTGRQGVRFRGFYYRYLRTGGRSHSQILQQINLREKFQYSYFPLVADLEACNKNNSRSSTKTFLTHPPLGCNYQIRFAPPKYQSLSDLASVFVFSPASQKKSGSATNPRQHPYTIASDFEISRRSMIA